MSIFKKNTEKHTEKLTMTGKVKKGFRIYCTAVMGAALVLGTSVILSRPTAIGLLFILLKTAKMRNFCISSLISLV